MTPELLTFEIPGNEQLLTSPHRLTCYQWGNEQAARTIICAHGLTRNGRDFDFLSQALARDYRVICPDMPGRGNSEWLVNPLGYNYPAYVADIQYILARLELREVHWIGTSMGGILGMMMTSMMPGLIQSLVLNDVGTVVSAVGLKRILTYAGIKMHYATREEGEAALRQICKPFGIRDEKHWRHFFDYSLQDMENGGVRFAYDPAIAASVVQGLDIHDINLWGLWPGVLQVPTLLIRGVDSDILTRETAFAMQLQHRHFELYEVPNTGHAPALMADEQINRIQEWLRLM